MTIRPEADGRSGAGDGEPVGGTVSVLGLKIAGRHIALAILTLIYILNYMDRQILSVLLQPIKEEFGVSDGTLGLLSGVTFALFYATLGIPIALLADRVNRRNVIAISLTVFSLMTVLCGMATQFWHLLLARIGVGIGEAGTSPPSHSMIADLYPPEQRATALAVYATGVNIGLMLGFFGAGWLNELYGWRSAFLVAGVPGLVLAVIALIALKEPVRGAADLRAMPPAAPRPKQPAVGAMTVLGTMWSKPSFRHLSFAGALFAFVGYGAVAWTPAFLIRTHGLTTGEVGTILSLMYGVLGLIGTIVGGGLADRLSKRDMRWQMGVPALAILASTPFGLGFFLSDDTTTALLFYTVPVLVGTVYLGPTFGSTQALAPLRMRAAAAALLLFILNIIGLGLGPWILGVLSDALRPQFGQDSLRYAMLIVSLVGLWSALHYALAARTLAADIAQTRAADS
ncbi:MAG: spinster family MFS transporter [Alphaproteobacteria bacterium]